MKRLRGWRVGLSDLLDYVESEVLYGVLPVVGHPQVLKAIRHSSAWLSRREQDLEETQVILAHQCQLAHQDDLIHTQVLLDEIKALLQKSQGEPSSEEGVDDEAQA